VEDVKTGFKGAALDRALKRWFAKIPEIYYRSMNSSGRSL
jgi:hypothetical protein